MDTSSLELKPLNKLGIELFVADTAFRPNPTTNLVAESIDVESHIAGKTVFDIGTGIGPLAIWAARMGAQRVYGVDPVAEQIDLAIYNVGYSVGKGIIAHGIVSMYRGDLFSPLEGMQADTVIADVAGLADVVGRALGWYPPAVPVGGPDGADVMVRMLDVAPRYLRESGALYFPMTPDFANGERIVAKAHERFGSVQVVLRQDFPLREADLQKITEAYGGDVPAFMRSVFTPNDRGRYVWHGEFCRASELK